ncbi:MAG TPA: hypothetical protein VGM76_03105 [Lacipirellulaceae bacterium]|jgi:hypothetical protein
MDQLRKAWDWFQRQHFWVLIVVSTLVALGCWWHGASALNQQFAANKQTIDQEFTSIKSEVAKPFHANDKLKDQQKAEIVKQGGSVLKIWQQLYDRQRENVLKWPDVLSKEFRQAVEHLKFGDEIAVNLRENYQNYVAGHFPVLPKIVDAKELAANESGGGRYEGRGMRGGGRGGYGGGSYSGREGGQSAEEEDEHVVQWLNQQDVRDELDMPNRPTSMKIWVTQEDLWVYETLLGVIKRTNDAAGADRASNAAVRIIESLEVGRLAAMESRTHGRIAMAEPAAGAPGGEAEGRGAAPAAASREMAMSREMGPESGGRGGPEDAASGDAALLANRYLDNEEKPIAAPDPAAGASAFGTEYKRLPVRMVLRMDQRWLPHLISECANAPLQVEVKEVRINPSETGGSAGYSRGGREMGGGYGSSSGQEGDQMGPEAEPNIKHVIIQGIIYIFNEPNTAAIQVADAQK